MQPADPMSPIPTRWEPPVCRRPDHRKSRKNPMSRNVQRTAPERPRQAQRNHRTNHPPCRHRHPSKPRLLPRRPGRGRRRKTPFRRPHAHHPHHPHQPQRPPIRLAEPQARDSDGARSMPRSRSPVPEKPQAPLVRGSETGMLRVLRQMSRHRRLLLERGHRGTPAHQSTRVSSYLHLPYGCLSIDDDGMRSPQANHLPPPHRQRRQPRRSPWPVP